MCLFLLAQMPMLPLHFVMCLGKTKRKNIVLLEYLLESISTIFFLFVLQGNDCSSVLNNANNGPIPIESQCQLTLGFEV